MNYGWSLDRNCWARLRTQAASFSWRRASLDAAWQSRVATTAGVYLICASPKHVPINGKVMERFYSAIYVGQASNLRRRFRDHVRGYGAVKDAKLIFRRLDFWFAEVEATALNEVERLLLETLGPPANIRLIGARIGAPVPAGQIGGQK